MKNTVTPLIFDRKYILEKYDVAIELFATSEEPLEKRLHDAYNYYLTHVKEENLPNKYKNQFKNVLDFFNRTYEIDINEVSKEEALTIIKEIIFIYDSIAMFDTN